MRVRKLLRKHLESRGYLIEHMANGLLWQGEPEFTRLLDTIKNRSLLKAARCFVLWQYARSCAGLGGEAAEVGVYKGGSAMLIASVYGSSLVHLFDTFAGIPCLDHRFDKIARQSYEKFTDTSEEDVAEFLFGYPNVRLHSGVFPSTAEGLEDHWFSFVHIDAAVYQAIKASCEFFYPRLLSGGVMIFDDYDSPECPGAREAVDEFFAGKPERPILLSSRQCIVHRIHKTREAS